MPSSFPPLSAKEHDTVRLGIYCNFTHCKVRILEYDGTVGKNLSYLENPQEFVKNFVKNRQCRGHFNNGMFVITFNRHDFKKCKVRLTPLLGEKITLISLPGANRVMGSRILPMINEYEKKAYLVLTTYIEGQWTAVDHLFCDRQNTSHINPEMFNFKEPVRSCDYIRRRLSAATKAIEKLYYQAGHITEEFRTKQFHLDSDFAAEWSLLPATEKLRIYDELSCHPHLEFLYNLDLDQEWCTTKAVSLRHKSKKTARKRAHDGQAKAADSAPLATTQEPKTSDEPGPSQKRPEQLWVKIARQKLCQVRKIAVIAPQEPKEITAPATPLIAPAAMSFGQMQNHLHRQAPIILEANESILPSTPENLASPEQAATPIPAAAIMPQDLPIVPIEPVLPPPPPLAMNLHGYDYEQMLPSFEEMIGVLSQDIGIVGIDFANTLLQDWQEYPPKKARLEE